MMRRGWVAALLALLLTSASGCAVRSNVGAYLDEPPPPASAAERERRCERYSNRLERTGRHMANRNTFGRLDLLRADHRRMERFVDAHCD